MARYSIEPRTRKYDKGYVFLSFEKKHEKQLLETGLDASKNVVHKAGEFLGNKISDVVTSQKIIILRNKNLLRKLLLFIKRYNQKL